MTDTETRETVRRGRVRRSGPKTVAALLLVIVLTAAVLTVKAVGGSVSVTGVKQTLRRLGTAAGDTVFSFDSGFNAAFTDLGDTIVTSGASGVAVYDGDGGELAREAFAAGNPVVVSAFETAVAYDVGGRGLRISDSMGNITPLAVSGDIISCSVGGTRGLFSDNIIVAVCMQGPDNYRGLVEFYRLGKITEKIYEWYSGEGYTLSAAVSPKNGDFAVLTITPRGGRIVFLDRTSTEPKGEYIHDGAAIIEIAYMKSGVLIARTADCLIAVDVAGEGKVIADFAGRAVEGYTVSGNQFIAVYLSDSAAGDAAGELITYDERGRELGRMRASRSPVWLEASGDRIAALWRDGLDIYDRNLKLVSSYPEASGMTFASPRGSAGAIALGSGGGKAFSGKTD